MSTTAISWVWHRSRSKGTDRLVLLVIAEHADHRGRNSWPANETIAEMCGGIDESTVRRSIARLRDDLGELKVELNGGGTEAMRRERPDRLPNLYTILLEHAPDRTKTGKKRRHKRGGADRTPAAETANPTPVVPHVSAPPTDPSVDGGADRTPVDVERGRSAARDGGAAVHERGCAGAPQTVLEPPTESSIPPNPHSVGAQGTREAGTNPRAIGTAPRDVGTNPRAATVDWFLEGARRDDAEPVLVEEHLHRIHDALGRGLDPEGARP